MIGVELVCGTVPVLGSICGTRDLGSAPTACTVTCGGVGLKTTKKSELDKKLSKSFQKFSSLQVTKGSKKHEIKFRYFKMITKHKCNFYTLNKTSKDTN